MTNEPRDYRPSIAIHPGETLSEQLDFINMSQLELSLRTGLSAKTINEIVKGISPITPQTALKLEGVLGISADFWNNLQANYDGTIARLEKEKQLEKEVVFAGKFTCYSELVNYGLVEKTDNPIERTRNLLRFFAIDSFVYLTSLQKFAFRRRDCKSFSQENLAAWLRWGEIKAEKIETKEFNASLIKENLPNLRKLTKSDNFSNELQRICAESGIAVVFTPCLKGTSVNGATRWRAGKPIIQVSDRLKWNDVFWFTFFHELGHILKHGKKEEFLELQDREKTNEEKEADDFAKRNLIPDPCYNEFLEQKNLSIQNIKAYADSIDVGYNILLGRLAKDKHLEWRAIQRHRSQIIIKKSEKAAQN